jgi:hypothetical protein
MQLDIEAPEPPASESNVVLDWRLQELIAASFPEELALALAISPHVDLHAALELRSRGCPPETAARILL